MLNCKPDFEQYPDERAKWPYKKFHDHHLITLLNGNPQAIILVAPLLADREKHLDLVSLYRKMTSNELLFILKQEMIEDSMMASLQLSAQVSIQFIKDSDPESMELFYLLGMLPGGISPKELDILWAKILGYKQGEQTPTKKQQ